MMRPGHEALKRAMNDLPESEKEAIRKAVRTRTRPELRRLLWVAVVTLAALILLLGPAVAEARERAKLKYAVVECSAWPWLDDAPAGSALRQLRRKAKDGKLRALFRVIATGRLAMLEARKLGVVNGKTVWSARGPKAVGAALQSAGCTVVQYKDVLALPAAKRDWIKARSSCVGEATRNGRTLSVWSCGAKGVVEVRVDGVGPLVMRGGSVRSVAGVAD